MLPERPDYEGIKWEKGALTAENLAHILAEDKFVKVAGIDVDGILRGKLMDKEKFLSIAKEGFGFCSVVFGWDMHDAPYTRELNISNKENGYRDLIAVPDLGSFRRIPWEDWVPLFLVNFLDPDTMEPLVACPRSLLKRTVDKIRKEGIKPMAGAEYEFFHFKTPVKTDNPKSSSSIAGFLKDNVPDALEPITEGMFGYSLTKPVHHLDYYYSVLRNCRAFDCDVESWHPESGPGVLEAALKYQDICEMADRSALFKLTIKSVAMKHGITPCFMAKPRQGLPGNSGHMHISLVDKATGTNLFGREDPDPHARWPDEQHLTTVGRHFLAGVLWGIPDVMPMLAPTVNSYKRLVENYWAPVTMSWGFEHRSAAVRVIVPPSAPPTAARLEVRVAGADANPHLALAAILAIGWRGVEMKLDVPVPPLLKAEGTGGAGDSGLRLARSLREATSLFMRPGSVSRQVFGDEFVDHFGGTREHECQLWEEAVTDW